MIKRVARLKSSWFKKFFCARVVAQKCERVMQSGFHRSQRDINGFGDFGELQSVDKTQEQNLAMFFREISQRGGEIRFLSGHVWCGRQLFEESLFGFGGLVTSGFLTGGDRKVL